MPSHSRLEIYQTWPNLGRVRGALGMLADVCCVLAFVVIGRASHSDGESLAGVASTAWPFLAGLAAGELAVRGWRRPLAVVPTGIGAWLGTVAAGQALRVIAGQGTAPAFVVVSLLFLGLFLLGWRLAVRRLLLRRVRHRLDPHTRLLRCHPRRAWPGEAEGATDER